MTAPSQSRIFQTTDVWKVDQESIILHLSCSQMFSHTMDTMKLKD